MEGLRGHMEESGDLTQDPDLTVEKVDPLLETLLAVASFKLPDFHSPPVSGAPLNSQVSNSALVSGSLKPRARTGPWV